jgi:predicted small secreted protein
VKRILLLLMLAVVLLISGCECVGGLGRDIQHAGQWIEETSKGMGQ